MLIANNAAESREYLEKHPEAVAIIEDFDFQTECWRPEFTDESQYYRKATVDDVKRISLGGWFGEPGVFAWLYPCGVPTYMRIGDAPRIKLDPECAWRYFDDAEEAYRAFKNTMYDHEFGYEPNDWDVLQCFGPCPDGYSPREWMESWCYDEDIIEAYERARKDVLKASGWCVD